MFILKVMVYIEGEVIVGKLFVEFGVIFNVMCIMYGIFKVKILMLEM